MLDRIEHGHPDDPVGPDLDALAAVVASELRVQAVAVSAHQVPPAVAVKVAVALALVAGSLRRTTVRVTICAGSS